MPRVDALASARRCTDGRATTLDTAVATDTSTARGQCSVRARQRCVRDVDQTEKGQTTNDDELRSLTDSSIARPTRNSSRRPRGWPIPSSPLNAPSIACQGLRLRLVRVPCHVANAPRLNGLFSSGARKQSDVFKRKRKPRVARAGTRGVAYVFVRRAGRTSSGGRSASSDEQRNRSAQQFVACARCRTRQCGLEAKERVAGASSGGDTRDGAAVRRDRNGQFLHEFRFVASESTRRFAALRACTAASAVRTSRTNDRPVDSAIIWRECRPVRPRRPKKKISRREAAGGTHAQT